MKEYKKNANTILITGSVFLGLILVSILWSIIDFIRYMFNQDVSFYGPIAFIFSLIGTGVIVVYITRKDKYVMYQERTEVIKNKLKRRKFK